MRTRKGNDLVPREKSRRVIHLEKRGHGKKKYALAIHIFRFIGVLCILYCGGIALAGFGTYFFLIWGVIGATCLILSGLLSWKRLMEAMPRWIKVIFCVLFCLGLLLFGAVEALILTQYHARAGNGADYCVILGAQWKEDGPSEALRRRLERAAEYLVRNPETMAIVSGGKGSNEKIAEAEGMREYLIQAGIGEERILVENSSSNTYENLVFSGALLDRRNDSVVIVTNNFHVFRALSIAKKQGYVNVEGLAADSLAVMAPNNLLREFFGVLKDFWVGNL